ncbi:MAG: phosphonate transporter, periplasmic substrate-binding protein [Gammaproteobacteria bacterium]|nr:phosphonate transporter, periplasmic substrate-binding protein [Gammaproteobacteria bacterium]
MKKIFLTLALFAVTSANASTCTLTLGDVRTAEKDGFFAAYSSLKPAIENATGCEFKIKNYATQEELYHAVINKQIDLAYLKDFPFYLAQKKQSDVKPIVVALSNSLENDKPSAFYSTYLLSRASDTSLNSLKDLQGKKIGVLERSSTSGYLVSWYALNKENISARFKQYSSYRALFKALQDGEVDAISTWDWSIKQNKAHQVHILKAFPQIPNPSIVMTHTLPEAQVDEIKNALLKITEKDNHKAVQGYSAALPNMFDGIFKVFDDYCQKQPNACDWK